MVKLIFEKINFSRSRKGLFFYRNFIFYRICLYHFLLNMIPLVILRIKYYIKLSKK